MAAPTSLNSSFLSRIADFKMTLMWTSSVCECEFITFYGTQFKRKHVLWWFIFMAFLVCSTGIPHSSTARSLEFNILILSLCSHHFIRILFFVSLFVTVSHDVTTHQVTVKWNFFVFRKSKLQNRRNESSPSPCLWTNGLTSCIAILYRIPFHINNTKFANLPQRLLNALREAKSGKSFNRSPPIERPDRRMSGMHLTNCG